MCLSRGFQPSGFFLKKIYQNSLEIKIITLILIHQTKQNTMTYLVTIGTESFLLHNQIDLKEAKQQAQSSKFWKGLKGKAIVKKISVIDAEAFVNAAFKKQNNIQ